MCDERPSKHDWTTPKCYNKFPACFQIYPGSCQKKNPGNVQDLHALARSVMPKFFDGLELDYTHRLSSNKLVTATWILSHTRPSGFRFGGYWTLRRHGDVLNTPTIHADINPSTLSSNVGIIFYPLRCLRLEGSMQRAAEDVPLMTEATIELLRPCATITANFYNVTRETGRSTLSFMRSITDHWAIGAELLLEWTEPNKIMADTAFAARFSHYNYSIAATVSRGGCDVSYWQRIHPKIQMANLFAWNRKTQKTIGTICYQWDFEDSFVRGMVDSDLSVGFMYFRTLPHIPCGMGMSLLMSLPTNRFIFGLRFNLDPSGFRRGD